MKERLAALSAHVTELEEDLDTARKDVLKFKDMNRKLKRDVRKDQLILNLETLRAELDQTRLRGAPLHHGLLLASCTLTSLPQLPALREEVGDDKTAIKCETSPPASLRSLQLDRLHTRALHTATHEDIRDAHNSTGSQDSPGNNPSSSTSRQDSLHKALKKKGIKSSISHLFRKKEKGWPEHPGKEALGPGRIFTPSATWKASVNADN
ncbi:liprin-alpha-1-like isoform X1 [Bos javanicus]|uniref:liprin-alpha-1-like isoform X1 n=1 Tax=Bos javanicus TaxID=9906 RepID=UPI002AA801B2|nr:liprin-alpha-1-like isoform X1 [Bos javanicus]XP_061260020.1 liprin-alpha-1-like isoform X1 [Bos javanicus]